MLYFDKQGTSLRLKLGQASTKASLMRLLINGEFV